MRFTEFEQGLLEASASLAKVTFEKSVCTVQWDFVAEYISTLQIRIDEDGGVLPNNYKSRRDSSFG